MIRDSAVRVAARRIQAQAAWSTTCSASPGVDPIRHGLLMEQFLSRCDRALPDIDIDVESARRRSAGAIFDRFGPERTACVSMMETYRVRHAVRDVGSSPCR